MVTRTIPQPFREYVRASGRQVDDFWTRWLGDVFYDWLPQFYESSKPAIPFEKLEVGQEASSEPWEITRREVIRFACATGDFNRAHTIGSRFFKRRPVAHGMLVASVWSKIFGTDFPGDETLYLEQYIRWNKPVYVGETVIGRVVITAIDKAKRRVTFDTYVTTAAGVEAVVGTATIFVPKAE